VAKVETKAAIMPPKKAPLTEEDTPVKEAAKIRKPQVNQ
jgi:hypothetical protein